MVYWKKFEEAPQGSDQVVASYLKVMTQMTGCITTGMLGFL